MKERPQFPDKKKRTLSFREVTDSLKNVQEIYRKWEIGQNEATWIPHTEYQDLPIAILLNSDAHYGSIGVNYQLLEKHLDIIENTPNMYVAFNGDEADFFNAIKHPSGMAENPVPPQIQARTIAGKITDMDRQSKVAVLSHGNHNDFGSLGGQDFYDSFLAELQAPIFTKGGLLTMLVGKQKYRMVMNHTYWGRSKINITNAPKRLLEYEGNGTCDIGWVGHTHQSSYEHFQKGKNQYLAIVSGTYKTQDAWAAKRGIGGRGSNPGITLMLWPNEKRMECFKDIEQAEEYLKALIFMRENQ